MPLPSPPWKLLDNGSCFRIKDASGRAFVYIYYRTDSALGESYLSREQALVIAKRFAALSKEAR